MTADLNQVFEAIGSLKNEVLALRRDIQQSDTRASDNSRRADEHRSVIHRRVDEFAGEVGEIREDVARIIVNMAAVKTDLAETKEIADEVRAWKQRGIGALAIVGIGASALTFVATQYFNQIAAFLSKG